MTRAIVYKCVKPSKIKNCQGIDSVPQTDFLLIFTQTSHMHMTVFLVNTYIMSQGTHCHWWVSSRTIGSASVGHFSVLHLSYFLLNATRRLGGPRTRQIRCFVCDEMLPVKITWKLSVSGTVFKARSVRFK